MYLHKYVHQLLNALKYCVTDFTCVFTQLLLFITSDVKMFSPKSHCNFKKDYRFKSLRGYSSMWTTMCCLPYCAATVYWYILSIYSLRQAKKGLPTNQI